MSNMFSGIFTRKEETSNAAVIPANVETPAQGAIILHAEKKQPLESFAPRPAEFTPPAATPHASGVLPHAASVLPHSTTAPVPSPELRELEVETQIGAEASDLYWSRTQGITRSTAGFLQAVQPVVAKADIQDPNVPTAEEQLAAQFYSYHIGRQGLEESTKTHKVLMGGDGLFIQKEIMVNGNKGVIFTPVDKVPGLPKFGKGSVEIKIENKVPYTILRQLLADFHAVCKLQRTEAAAQVFKTKDGKFEIYYPEQDVSGASARYRNDQDNAHERWGDKELVLEVHSHNNFGAFFSGTDDANEHRPGIYGVFGMLDSAQGAFVSRFRYEKIETRLSLGEVFDLGDITESQALTLKDLPEPDKVLLERVKKSASTFKGFTVHGAERFERMGMDGAYGGYYGRGFGGYGLDDDYMHRMGVDVYDDVDSKYPINKHRKASMPAKTTKKSRKKKVKKMLIDAGWVVDAMTDPAAIRKLIVALDDKLSGMDKAAKKEAEKAAKVESANAAEAEAMRFFAGE
jgi:hypothetical protein